MSLPPPLPETDHSARAAALGWLFLVAAVLGPVSVIVPHDPVTVVWAELVISAFAGGLALLVRVRGPRLAEWAYPVLVATGTLLASAAIHFSGGAPNSGTMFYLWVSLFAFYFMSRRVALAQVALIGACFAVVLVLRPPPFPAVSHWTTTIGTILGAGLLVGVLRTRMDALITRLADAARTDVLTGLLNRRGFQQVVELEIERSRRTGRPFALVVGDLDHFKTVNDRLGHAGGDAALRRLAELLDDHKRKLDTAARVGGEEFALLLPETDMEAALVVAERLRAALAADDGPKSVGTTGSFGVATYPQHGPTQEALAHSADQALYAAKATGRNRVVAYEPGATERLLKGPPPELSDHIRANAIVLLAESLDLRDPSTAAHSRTVATFAESIAREMGLDEERVERIRLAGILHDVGKISVPDAVLHKPGPLTPGERILIRKHPDMGARLLEGAGLEVIAGWVRAHHERPDGLGYPRGLTLDEIPLEARILAVADAYEAMTADRPYRAGVPAAAAWAELEREAGTQFDPVVIAAFDRALHRRGVHSRTAA